MERGPFGQVAILLNTFALSLLVAQLYFQLHTYSDRLLLTRMIETGLGTGIAIAAALTIFRLRTSDVAKTAITTRQAGPTGSSDVARRRRSV